jgi:hypothetical protein
MKIQIISTGKRKSGIKTAQVVIKESGKSKTRHLAKNGNGGVWQDRDAKIYDLPNN